MPAAAQSAAPQNGASEANEPGPGNSGIQDIVVTAQRRAESLQSVPVSITALSSSLLANAGVQDTTQLGPVTPNLVMTQQNTSILPYIRGVGTSNFSAGSESPVAFYVNNVYVSAPYAGLLSLGNIERIEVLRGPQGVSFGRNATAGIIRIITKSPSTDPQMNLSLSYGNYGTAKASVFASGGLAQNLTASIAGTTSYQSKGYGYNTTTRTDIDKGKEVGGRAELQYNSGDLTIRLAGDYNERAGDIGLNRSPAPGEYTADRVRASLVPEDTRISRSDTPGSSSSYQWGVSLSTDLQVGQVLFTNTAALRRSRIHALYDQDTTALNLADVHVEQSDSSFQEELVASTDIGRLNLVLGGFYYESRSKYLPTSSTSRVSPAVNIQRFSDLGTRSYAAFGQATYAVTDTTNLTGGIRYTRERKTGLGSWVGGPGNPFAGQILAVGTTKGTIVQNYSKVTFRLSADQKLTDGLMGYVSFNRGFKAGGFNGSNVTNPAVLPEILDAYEAGLKGDFLDRQLRINLSGYAYDYSNIQLNQSTLAGFVLVNAARAKTSGIEFETIVAPRLPFGSLTARVSGAYAKGHYSAYPNAPIILLNPVGTVPAGLTCPLPLPTNVGGGITCVGDLTGNTTIRTPKITLSAGLDYSMPVGSDELSFGVDVFKSSKFYFDANNRLTNPSYAVLNGRITYAVNGNNLRLTVFGQNLTDSLYYSSGVETSLADQVTVAPPRTYGVRLEASF